MAWYPFAKKLPINPGPNDPPITVIGAILHVDSGNASSLYKYFRDDSGGIESHFFIKKDGSTEQYRSTGVEADANLKANSFIDSRGRRVGFVSIETQGYDRGEWTTEQLVTIKRLLSWLSTTHDFPLTVCKTSTSPGVGYHTMFGAPGPWTPVAKTCPGIDRIRQFEKLLVPWFASLQEEDMPLTETEWKRLGELIYDKNALYGKNLWTAKTGTGTALRRDIAAIKAAMNPAALAAAIVAKLPADAIDQATVEAGVRAVLKEGTEE